MATIALQRIEPAKLIHGNSPKTMTLPLGATQTFKRGEPVYLLAGYVTVATASTKILGIAAEDATSGTAGATNIKVWIGDPNTVFVGNKGSSGLTATTALIDRGKAANFFDATGTQSGVWTLDITGTAQCQIVDLDSRDTVGDTRGRVHFIIKPSASQLLSTS